MNRFVTILPRVVLAGLFLAAMWMPSPAGAQATGGSLRRLAADGLYHGGGEASTALEPPGVDIYQKTVLVPLGVNTLYLTMSTTGDAHGGAGSCFSANVDGNFFNGGDQGAARCADNATTPVSGWVTLLKLPDIVDAVTTNCNSGGGGSGDCHDNSITYQWCTPITPGVHDVEVRMATSNAGQPVFIEQAFFYVDANQLFGSACDPLLPVPPPTLP